MSSKTQRIFILIFTLFCGFLLTAAVVSALDIDSQPAEFAADGAARSESVKANALAVGTLYYVSKDGDNTTGTSWATAYTNLQGALNVAVSEDEIWVASGIYTPGATINDSFYLVPGAAIYGGFAATETVRTDRNWMANPTILSGDIAGDDTTDGNGVVTTTVNISGSNSIHVVYADGASGTTITTTTVLNGFTVTAGQRHPSGSYPNELGGGFYCGGDNVGNECSPTLSHIIFSGNSAVYGGAMVNSGFNRGMSSPILTDVTFSGNSAEDGGAMYNFGDSNGISNPDLNNVSFLDNSADNNGGAMYNSGVSGSSSPKITNGIFTGNEAGTHGGAMYNSGVSGGSSSPTFHNVSFTANSADGEGGAVYNYGYFGASSPILANVLFSGNLANYGGAMVNYGLFGASDPSMVNVTFSGNSAVVEAGAIYNEGFSGSSRPDVSSSIFWNNKDSSGTGSITATIRNFSSTITLTNTLLQGSGGSDNWTNDASFVNGGDNLDSDPFFISDVSPDDAPTAEGDLHLADDSPAIDAGNNDDATLAFDLDGNLRISNGTVDMGVYETQFYTATVVPAGSGTGLVSGDGINCGITCTKSYIHGTTITLTGAADVGSTFFGWTGAGCNSTGSCVVTMSEARNVTATFTLNQYELSLLLPGTGSGLVSFNPPGFGCEGPCNHGYDFGTVVTLTADADSVSTFTNWGGACSGIEECVITMTEAISVTANFTINQYELSVSLDGTGSGSVSSSPGGISCESDCSEFYDYATSVTLTPGAVSGSTFSGWSGACDGVGDCVVTMTEAKSVTATFMLDQMLTVALDGTGSGSVNSSPPGIACLSDCTEMYAYNSEVTLTAAADAGSTFSGWDGACDGVGDCVVTMDEAKNVTATFTELLPGEHVLTVVVDGSGSGTVTGTGINCFDGPGADCTEVYVEGTAVPLSAAADSSSTFSGWSGGGCSGVGACVVTMSSSKNVTATFTLKDKPDEDQRIYLPVIIGKTS